MFKSRIVVDLPSAETERRKGPIEWLRSLFGAQLDLRSGREELTVSALWLVEGLVEGFAAVGVHDVISFLVDKQVVYLDHQDVPDDLPMVVQAAEAAGVLDRKFREMHLVLAHRGDALHAIIDCTIQNGVLLGEAEMTIALSGRVRALQIESGETAQHYADRVRAFAAGGESFEPGRRELDALTEKIAHELSSVLAGARVQHEPAVVQLVRPDARQIGNFRHLRFGDHVRPPAYRAVPAMQRRGAYDDPFYDHYYDPYYDFTNYVIVDSMVHAGAWHSGHVHVVDPQGHPLFVGDAPPGGGDGSWIGDGAVSFGDDGELEINRSIPELGTLEAPSWLGGGGDAPSDHAGDHGSGSWGVAEAPDGGSSWSDDSSADHSSSSCSSSTSCSSSSSRLRRRRTATSRPRSPRSRPRTSGRPPFVQPPPR